jgi:hypothetical protein
VRRHDDGAADEVWNKAEELGFGGVGVDWVWKYLGATTGDSEDFLWREHS